MHLATKGVSNQNTSIYGRNGPYHASQLQHLHTDFKKYQFSYRELFAKDLKLTNKKLSRVHIA